MEREWARWRLHLCALDRECRDICPPPVPWRLYVFTPRLSVAVALNAQARFFDKTGRARWMTVSRGSG